MSIDTIRPPYYYDAIATTRWVNISGTVSPVESPIVWVVDQDGDLMILSGTTSFSGCKSFTITSDYPGVQSLSLLDLDFSYSSSVSPYINLHLLYQDNNPFRSVNGQTGSGYFTLRSFRADSGKVTQEFGLGDIYTKHSISLYLEGSGVSEAQYYLSARYLK